VTEDEMTVRLGVVWQSRRGTVGSGVDGFGTKGASMNQIMVNAVEFDSLLKEVEYLKHENQKLKEQLKDTQDRIRILKEEVGFAERGYTKL
jgi:predicted RNase H-like nuclease (RuvC/YqgF family)